MEDIKFKITSCKLCLCIIHGENFVMIDDFTKEILNVLLLKLDFDDDSKYVMCNVCLPKLYDALNFKSVCLETDDAITPYIEDPTVLPIDLKEIYMKERGSKHVPDDVKICRLCMQPIKDGSEFKLINQEEIDMIQRIVPEMKIFKIKEPVTCHHCLDSLATHYNFLKKCSDVNVNIGNTSNWQVRDIPSPVPSLHTSLKIEDVDIKFEDLQQSNDTKSEIYGQEIFKNQETQWYKCNFCNYSTNMMPSLSTHEIAIHKQPKEIKKSDYQLKFKGNLKHSDPSEVQMYNCESCNFKTKRKRDVTRHMLVHKNVSEMQMYKCKSCNYKTKRKTDVTRHMLIHKDAPAVKMYKCKSCNYKTKHKRNVTRHMLIHKDAPEVQMYKCKSCNYKTKRKRDVTRHNMLIHKDAPEVQMYKCKSCNYKTKRKRDVKRHMLVHKDVSEVQMYKCNSCNHESKHKWSLTRHMLIHKDAPEVQMYKCKSCNYKTKRKRDVTRHNMLIHKDAPEVKMYKCESCNYKTKRKRDVKRHMLVHKDASEVQM